MYNSGNGIIKREIPHKMSFEGFSRKQQKTHKIPNDQEASGIFLICFRFDLFPCHRYEIVLYF